MYGNVGGGNYGTVGQKLNQQQVSLHGVNAEASPDYGKIAQEAIKGRSKERRAAIAAEASVHQTGLSEMSKTKQYEIKAKSDKDVADAKKPAQRFAGIVGAAGTIGGAVVLNKFNKDAEKRALDAEAKAEARHQEKMDLLRKPRPKPAPIEKPPTLEMPTLIKPGEEPTNQQSGNVAPGTTTKPGKGSSSSPQSQGSWSFQQVSDLATKVGFTPEGAKMISAISGAESRRDPTNSTRRSGLYKQTGEDSVGLTQINWGYHKDRGWLQKLGITSREQLYDPETNLKAALYLHQQSGGWSDWTVYDSGKYKDWF